MEGKGDTFLVKKDKGKGVG